MRRCFPLWVILALVLAVLAGCGGPSGPPPIDRFVAVGYDGGIYWSDNITDWTDVSHTGGNLFGLAYGGGRLVTVGANNTCWSTDGSDWADASAGVAWGLGGAAYGNGKFVAVGGKGYVSTSTDGDSWVEIATPSDTGTGNNLRGVAFGNGYFVVVGDRGQIWRSANGSDWTPIETASMSKNNLESVTYGNGLFVAVGAIGQFAVSTDDGANWTKYTKDIYELTDVAYLNGEFVVVGVIGRIYTSNANTIANASEWDDHSLLTSANFFGVTYGQGYYVVVGSNGVVLRSADKAVWTPMLPMAIPLTTVLRDVIYLP